MKKIFYILFIILFFTGCAPAKTVPTSEPPTSTAFLPTETPIPPTPTLALVEINGGSYSQRTGYDYDAYDSSGNLAYVKDVHGNWIKASYEVPLPSDNSLLDRLGSNFVFNSDNTGITGIDGLKIDSSKSLATFNFDGKGEESFSTGDIHVVSKDINGQLIKPTLLVAGYSWNGETKTWEVYNPGFPMDSPKDELAWFTQADIANGNWLRWHQRVIEGLAKQNNEDAETYMKNLFAGAIVPDRWGMQRYSTKNVAGQQGTLEDYGALMWILNDQNETDKISKYGITKEENPMRGGISYGYLVDSGVAIISLNVLNGNGTTTSLPLIMDDTLWTKHRNDAFFTRAAYAAGKQWDSSMAKDTLSNILQTNVPETWLYSADILYYPDSTVSAYLGTKDLAILQDQQGVDRREAAMNGNIIEPQASLDMWGGYVKLNAQEALKIGK